MRKIFVFVLAGSLLTLTSCIEMVEELFLNKDGSGQYVMTIDMSSLFTNPLMMGMMEETLKSEFKMGEEESLEKDSIMYYKDFPGASQLTAAEKALLGNSSIHMQMSQEKKQMLASTKVEFKNFDEFEKINALVQKISNEGGQNGITGGSSPFASNVRFKLESKKLVRLPDPAANSAFEGEEMQMAKMFLEDATITSIYHLPGKVKKTTIQNAKVDGKTVTVIADMLDIIDKKAMVEGEIVFKKR